ncbi:guanylate-binding protein 1-like [Heteronotia binoei]|uniref:guanylate-binding protein 1-like n=1 Tax=Heteronotia binoei TaxID=13085 RepID=UPI00292DA070|nr:guanylate-binding protein 1-like [Heteronotia binoei]
MAPQIPMESPTCLIENRPDGTLVVDEKAMHILLNIRQPVVVVAIVGLYRTGKSYLMNRLAGKRKGFCLGATVQGQTKGIWVWCLPHPRRPDHTLVLLDTEGLGDVQKGNTQNDSWIFALAILLSSTLVYNSMGTIDEVALEKLHYVTELTKKIHTKSSGRCQEEENSAEFVRFFPAFIWAVRDFTLQLEIDGQRITGDEYLESALKLQQGNTEQIQKCNMPRLCIRRFFPSRKCFTFDRPANKRKLAQLEELEEEDLEPDFLEPMNDFSEHIWNTSQSKMLPGGRVVSGTMLANLAKNYVESINSGQVPCLENAVQALAEIENAAAVREALSRYEELMKERLKLPTETVEELLGVHAEYEREATGVFMAHAFGDHLEKFQADLVRNLQERKEEFCRRNEQVSSDHCLAVLMDLSQELDDGITKGIYSVPGGYQRFLEKQHEIVEKYRLVSGKGIQAEMALEEFLRSKKSVAESILQMDKTLSDKEKEIEAERARAQEAQLQQQFLKQNQDRLTQMVEDQKRTLQEQLQLLQEKMERDKEAWREETERVVQHKLKEREQLLKEGFSQKASEMQNEIHRLKKGNYISNSSTVMSALAKTLHTTLFLIGQGLHPPPSLFPVPCPKPSKADGELDLACCSTELVVISPGPSKAANLQLNAIDDS